MAKEVELDKSALEAYVTALQTMEDKILNVGTAFENMADSADKISTSFDGLADCISMLNSLETATKDAGGSFLETGANIATILTALKDFEIISGKATTAIKLKEGAMLAIKPVINGCRALLTSYTTTAGTATVATTALAGACTLGLGVAFIAITTLLGNYLSSADDASEATENLARAQEELRSAQTKVQAEMDIAISKVSNFSGTKEEEKKLIDDLNRKYGDIFGTYDTLSSWYDVLTSKSELYVKQKVNEARINQLAAKSVSLQMEADDLQAKAEAMPDKKSFYIGTAPGAGTMSSATNGEKIKTLKAAKAKEEEAKRLNEEMNQLVKQNYSLQEEINKGLPEPATKKGKKESSSAHVTEMDAQLLVDTIIEKESMDAVPESIQRQLKEFEQLGAAVIVPIEPVLEDNPEVDLPDMAGIKLQADLEMRAEQFDQAMAKVRELEGLLKHCVTPEERAALEEYIGQWREIAGPVAEMEEKLAQSKAETEAAAQVFDAMGSTFNSLGQAVGGSAGEMLQWGAQVAQSIAAAIPAIASLITTKNAESVANTEAAATGAASSVSFIPFVGPAMAVAAVASVLAALAGIPKFAKGGIAYGPTLGLFGEYSGAQNNPEVVAPLDRLRDLIQPEGSGGGRVEFAISGRKLVGILERENNVRKRS